MPPARSTRILVLDFDGTVCIGDAPVLLYGRLLEERVRALPGHGSAHGGEQSGEHGSEHEEGGILPALEEYLAVEDRAALRRERSDDLDEAIDGYAAAQLLARRRGLGPEDMESAYQASRRALAVAGDIETSAPAGLAAFLEGLPRSVRRVLVTNAPADGIAAQLEHLGIAGGIDEIVPERPQARGHGPDPRAPAGRAGARGLPAEPAERGGHLGQRPRARVGPRRPHRPDRPPRQRDGHPRPAGADLPGAVPGDRGVGAGAVSAPSLRRPR
jgi:FMN phosphatase YigB (HAD superfamily)